MKVKVDISAFNNEELNPLITLQFDGMLPQLRSLDTLFSSLLSKASRQAYNGELFEKFSLVRAERRTGYSWRSRKVAFLQFSQQVEPEDLGLAISVIHHVLVTLKEKYRSRLETEMAPPYQLATSILAKEFDNYYNSGRYKNPPQAEAIRRAKAGLVGLLVSSDEHLIVKHDPDLYSAPEANREAGLRRLQFYREADMFTVLISMVLNRFDKGCDLRLNDIRVALKGLHRGSMGSLHDETWRKFMDSISDNELRKKLRALEDYGTLKKRSSDWILCHTTKQYSSAMWGMNFSYTGERYLMSLILFKYQNQRPLNIKCFV